MTIESLMTNGYPSQADIISDLAAAGIEIPTEGVTPYTEEFLQFVWGLYKGCEWAVTLSVYCPSATTINVRGGNYLYKGTVKEYTPGSAIDPTDSDTTYVWLLSDNTVDSGIDGSGWPSAEHIKLAEVDVDASGNITAIRDLRGQAFMAAPKDELLSSTAIDLNAVADTAIYTVPTGKKLTITYDQLRELSGDAGSAQNTVGQASAKTDFLNTQTLSNLNAAGKAGRQMPVPSATTPAIVEYAAGTVIYFCVTQAAGSACTCIVDLIGTLADAG